MLVLRNCRLVGALTEDVSLDSADILILAGLIASIDPCGARYDGEFTELDINGATVLPGLIDAHVHLHYTRPTQPDSFFVDPCTRSFDVLTYAQYLLSLGITTVRDCGDDMYYPSVAVRNAIAQGIGHLHPLAAAEGMFFAHMFINFFVASGSGQAVLTMPVMIPLSDLIGVNPQLAILAYQFGEGWTNAVIPTAPVTMAAIGMAGIPWLKWARWNVPLQIVLAVLSMLLLIPPYLLNW